MRISKYLLQVLNPLLSSSSKICSVARHITDRPKIGVSNSLKVHTSSTYRGDWSSCNRDRSHWEKQSNMGRKGVNGTSAKGISGAGLGAKKRSSSTDQVTLADGTKVRRTPHCQTCEILESLFLPAMGWPILETFSVMYEVKRDTRSSVAKSVLVLLRM